MADLFFRKAIQDDLPFLIAGIAAAEKLETGRSTYEALFQLSAPEVANLLGKALLMEGIGYQLALSTFSVGLRGGDPVACCSAWIEAEDGISSGFKMAALLSDLLGFEKWLDAGSALKAFADALPRRTPGALQMETFYVEPGSRGQGLTTRLIDQVLHSFDRSAEIAEITLLEENTQALRAYRKAGFHIHCKGDPGSTHFRTLTGSAGFVQLQKTFAIP